MTSQHSGIQMPWLVPLTSELLDRLLLQEQVEAGGGPGTFVRKSVRGATYWYVQHPNRKQVYFGPDTEQERLRRQQIQEGWDQQREAARSRKAICDMLRGGETLPVSATLAKLLVALHQQRLHQTGAVVVGTYAFLAYQGLLGVKWSPRMSATQDVDVASEVRVELLTPEPIQLWPVLASLGLQPTAPVGRLMPTTFVTPAADARVDVLTPMRGRPKHDPVPLDNLSTHGEPLRFLDYLIADPVLLPLPVADGVMFHFPQPARFALHKLIVSKYRKRADKRIKDVAQAEALLDLLAEYQPAEIRQACTALPRSWQTKALAALEQVGDDVRGRVRTLVGS